MAVAVGRGLPEMSVPQDFVVVLAVASLLALAVVVFLGWRKGCWAFPWPGVGEEIESFEDLLATLRLAAFPAALAALLFAGGFLLYRAWDGTFFTPPKPEPCPCPAAAKAERPTCLSPCRDIPIDGDLPAAVKGLTKAVNGVAGKLDGDGAGEMARKLAAIEQTLAAIAATMTKVGPASADLLDRLDKLRTGLQAVAEAIAKPATPPWADRFDEIEKALREIARKSGTMPADLFDRLDKLQAALHPLTAMPELPLRLNAIEKALREIALMSGTAPADLLDRLDKLRAGLADVSAAAAKPAPAAPGELLARLDAIENALRAVLEKPGPASADLLDRLDKLRTGLTELAAAAGKPAPVMPTELLERLDAIKNELRRIADNGAGQPPLLPPRQLDDIVKILTAIQISVNEGRGLGTVIEHLTMIEAILSDLPYPSPISCGPVPGFVPLTEPTPSERRLMDLAKRRGLTTAQQYRVTKRQIFFDPKANQPSEIGMRLLRLAAETARRRGAAVAIRAEADNISDGADAEAMARQRAATVADYLAQHAPVPLVGIGLAAPVGTASEPYRRIVRIDLLDPCPALGGRERAPETGPRTR